MSTGDEMKHEKNDRDEAQDEMIHFDMQKMIEELQQAGFADAAQTLLLQDRRIDRLLTDNNRLSGRVFITTSELLRHEWVDCIEADYTGLCRNWRTYSTQIQGTDVLHVYSASRRAALDITTELSASQTLTKVNSSEGKPLLPVRLCCHEKSANYAEKARLCPKTGDARKAETWMYAIAAVLGMPWRTHADRAALLKATCGSVASGKTNVMTRTGINRSPFNLLSFLSQDVWFDRYAGVLVLPVMDVSDALQWDGKSYSIIILCDTVRPVSTADDIATSIGLTRTSPEHLHAADKEDLQKAISLLTRVIKASAFCLDQKEGPDGGKGEELWKLYTSKIEATRIAARMMSHDDVPEDFFDNKVPVPTFKIDIIPEGRLVAKINLSEMAPPEEGASAAYPDPLLLAYKSTPNWTRRFAFQLMAEAEPQEHARSSPAGTIPFYIGGSDHCSKTSSVGYDTEAHDSAP